MSLTSRSTIRDSLSISLTVGAYGIAFGATGVAAGFSVLQSCLLSQESLGGDAMHVGFWNIFTLAGVLGAQALGNPASCGLDAAVPAAFLGLVWPRLESTSAHLLGTSAGVLALALTPLVSAGCPSLPRRA